MADKERITNPSMGSNELGTETNDKRQTGVVSAGSNTQLKLAALGGKKDKEKKLKTEHSKRKSQKKSSS
ncbi:MAG: hypothetical protein ABI297_05440 [Ginsengibacter sp.]